MLNLLDFSVVGLWHPSIISPADSYLSSRKVIQAAIVVTFVKTFVTLPLMLIHVQPICQTLTRISSIWKEAPYVRESKTVLDSGFNAVDFGFLWLDFGFFVSGFRIPIVRGILHSEAQNSGFHKKLRIYGFQKNNFYGFRNPYPLTWAKEAKESIGTAWYREKIDQ